MRALKDSFRCKITLLTSRAASVVVPHLPEVDNAIVCDAPWVKQYSAATASELDTLIDELKAHQFDGAIIFSVYSQSTLPAALLLYMAHIPKRLAYARENPYLLLTDWVPDQEPYSKIVHQVSRDLALVASIGAHTSCEELKLQVASLLRGRKSSWGKS